MSNPYRNLTLGLVKENFALIPRAERAKWRARGFRRAYGYPVFHRPANRIVMLGRPQTLSEFGADRLIGCKITGFDLFGTYGMGGAGFFGFKFHAEGADRCLVFCAWDAGSHLLLDGRVMGAHPQYEAKYQPWIRHGRWMESVSDVREMLCGMEITAVTLSGDACAIALADSQTGGVHRLETFAESEQFPPQAGTGKRRNVCEKCGMEGLWLVIYDGTELRV